MVTRGSKLHNAPILQMRTQEQVKKLKEHLTPKAHSPKHLMHCPTESSPAVLSPGRPCGEQQGSQEPLVFLFGKAGHS